MVRIVVDNNVVSIPEPIADVIVVVWGNAKEEAAKPEAVSVPSSQAVDVAGADRARETPMLPGVIEVVVGIISARVVTDPTIGPGVDMRRIRMPGLFSEIATLVHLGRSATTVLALLRTSAAIWGSRGASGCARRSRRRAARWDVPASHRRANAALAATTSLLGKSRKRTKKQHGEKSDQLFHVSLRS
jgi:hypothetical protein